MTPDQVAAALRTIADRIALSKRPSRSLVANDLRVLISRLAARLDVVNSIDQAFEAAGVYPPDMKEVSKGVYQGDIDKGWTLEAEESPKGLKVKLNGHSLKTIDEAAKAYKGKDAKYAQPYQAPAQGAKYPKSQKDIAILDFLYGRHEGPVTAFDDQGDPIPGVDERWGKGSQLFWDAFQDLDVFDWFPGIDYQKVIDKTRELAENIKVGKPPAVPGYSNPQLDSDAEADEARRNWESYEKHYMQNDIKRLKDAGLM